MTTPGLLPAGFAALEAFVPAWTAATSAERDALRGAASAAEREVFFTAASALLDPALDHLDRRDLAALKPDEQRLLQLMLSLAHVAQAVETQGPDEDAHRPWRQRMRITRSAADAA